MPPNTTVAVAFHSGHGHTARQARAVARGAETVERVRAETWDVSLADEPMWQALDAADAIVFGSPTYMGGTSAAFQSFAEASARVWARRGWQGKLAAGFTNSAGVNGNKDNTLAALAVLAAQHGMVWVPLGLMPGGDYSTDGSPDDLNRLAGFVGAMAQSPSDVGPEGSPSRADLRTAEHLGTRVAELASLLARARATVTV